MKLDATQDQNHQLIKDPLNHIQNKELKNVLEQLKINQGYDLISTTSLTKPLTIDFYKNWLKSNHHADMSYLETHLPLKESAQKINPLLKSAITITQNYFPQAQALNDKIPARIALYAKNQDYHFWLKDKLKASIDYLSNLYPEHVFLPFVDSGPVLERDLAYRSGLGWFGKNTCLLHSEKGSLFFLSEILTSLDFDEMLPLHKDLCGTCTRCIDICPTKALENDKTLNANKCISFLTIEAKTIPAKELRPLIGDWFFGCDLCQTVCPWNQKKLNFLENLSPDKSLDPVLQLSAPEDAELVEFLKEILTLSNKKIQKKFYGTALLRSGGFGLKRNALIVVANRKIKSLKLEVEKNLTDPKLTELAQWTLDILQSP